MSIDEHYDFISSVGFQQKLNVKFLLLKESKTKLCCEVSRFILKNFRTKSPKYDRISSYLLTRCGHGFT